MSYVLIRGGGDLATGTAVRLFRSGFKVVLLELPQPLAVRRTVAFAEAVYEGEWRVEGVVARRAASMEQARRLVHRGIVPVLVAPQLDFSWLDAFDVLIDARLTKRPPETDTSSAPLVIGLGPGFVAGRNCHAVIETQRGPTLGRAYWSGSALADTSKPAGDPRRVVRAPCDGIVVARAAIGQQVDAGEVIASIGEVSIESPLGGILRGLIRPGALVSKGMKIGDVDSRNIRAFCFQISDKASAVGEGVLEAILSHMESPDPRVRGAESAQSRPARRSLNAHLAKERIAGIILAAGASRRFGRPKQLLEYLGRPFVCAVAETALAAGLSPVLVVTGCHAEEVETALSQHSVTAVRNEVWQQGQGTSVRTGVAALPPEIGAAVILLADQPQVSPSVIRALAEEHTRGHYPIIVPLVDTRRGNPVLFDRTTFSDLLELEGDTGGRAVFGDHRVHYLPWSDRSLLLDVDRIEDYQVLLDSERSTL